jgi:histone deacetylase complex regulatory component SIN3
MNSKTVKKVNEQSISKEISELNKVVVLVVETDDLLEQLEAKSISEFEDSINKKSGFVNSLMSATAYGKDVEYKRLLELEKLINNRLTSEDLNPSKELKNTLIENIKEKHTEYYTEEDLVVKKSLQKIMKTYNALSHTQRQQIGFNPSYELIFSPFSDLRF